MICFFKDRFLPESDCHLSIHDRSFRFGDGVFETLLVTHGNMVDFPVHAERLHNGLMATRITLELTKLRAQCEELISRNNLRNGYLRIVISRGENGLGAIGYLPKDTHPYLLIQSMEKPYPAFGSMRLWLAPQHAGMHMPSKTNNALLYTLAMMDAQDNGCDNALLLNEQGIICETASGNIFWVKDGALFTPATDLALVPGTVRRRVLEQWPGKVTEGHFTLHDLQAADEVFMTNIGCIAASIVELQPSGKCWPVGEHTLAVRARLDAAFQGSTAGDA